MRLTIVRSKSCRIELLRAPDGKRRHDVETESRGVIVVDQEYDIRLLLRDPAFGEVVAGKHRRPIGIPCFAVVERRANRRDMRGRDASGDASHYSNSLLQRLQ